MTKTPLFIAAILAALAWSSPAETTSSGYLGLKLERLEGSVPCVRIEAVVPSSPAARAGVHEGDLVSKVDGIPLDCASADPVPLPVRDPGTKVLFSLVRDGQPLEINFSFEARPTSFKAPSERDQKMAAGEAVRQRLVANHSLFTIVMQEDGDYRYEGVEAKDAALLRWLDDEVMLGPQMRKLFQPGRYDLYLEYHGSTFRFVPAAPK